MNAGVWFLIAIGAGALLLWFGYKKHKADNSATITINDAPEEEVPSHPSYNREEIKPVAVPEDAAPVEPNPSVDRKEAEQEVLQEIIEEDKPLTEVELLESPMVEPLDNPPTSPEETADLDPVGDVVVEKKTFSGSRFTGNLTDDEVRAIRTSEKTVAELALQYDKSDTTIRRIKNRQSYAHVE